MIEATLATTSKIGIGYPRRAKIIHHPIIMVLGRLWELFADDPSPDIFPSHSCRTGKPSFQHPVVLTGAPTSLPAVRRTSFGEGEPVSLKRYPNGDFCCNYAAGPEPRKCKCDTEADCKLVPGFQSFSKSECTTDATCDGAQTPKDPYAVPFETAPAEKPAAG